MSLLFTKKSINFSMRKIIKLQYHRKRKPSSKCMLEQKNKQKYTAADNYSMKSSFQNHWKSLYYDKIANETFFDGIRPVQDTFKNSLSQRQKNSRGDFSMPTINTQIETNEPCPFASIPIKYVSAISPFYFRFRYINRINLCKNRFSKEQDSLVSILVFLVVLEQVWWF